MKKNMDDAVFKTPSKIPVGSSRLRDQNFPDAPVSPVAIPASPMMQKLGWGTGVVVYRLDRDRNSVSKSACVSPWAVKKAKSSHQRSTEPIKRLIKEGEVLRKLNHPNIVGFRDFEQLENGDTCLAMEEGGNDLSGMIENQREDETQFSAYEVASVAINVAKALSYLHNTHKLLHGDIKSANILISDSFKKVKLCDFGVSILLKDDLSGPLDAEEQYIGTGPWSSKEVLENEVISDKADIFSYGLVIWEMLALDTPHIHLLRGDESDLDGSYISSDADMSIDDTAYHDALGTRPPLPSRDLNADFMPIVGLFACCTEEDYRKRPNAKQVVEAFQPTAQAMGIK